MPNEDKLKNKLKRLLENDRLRTTARAIEDLNVTMFPESRFIYGPEAETLAGLDTDQIEKFFTEVKRIKQSLEADYHFAIKSLTAEDGA